MLINKKSPKGYLIKRALNCLKEHLRRAEKQVLPKEERMGL